MTRVVFMGSPDLAVPSLEALIAVKNIEVVAVFTQPDRPVGRGRKLQPSPVKVAALQHGLTVHTPQKISAPDVQPLVEEAKADLAIVCAYGHILPDRLLALFPAGCYNLHFSLLPRWRGASPVQAAILAGDVNTGVSLQSMVRELDAGPIVSETPPMEINPQETAGELAPRLATAAAELLSATLPILIQGNPPKKEQDHDQATFCRTIQKSAGRVDVSAETAKEIDRKVRAYHPWPGGFAFLEGRRLSLEKVVAMNETLEPEGVPSDQAVGVVHPTGWVKTREGWLQLVEVKPEGKRAMAWADFVRGRPLAPTAELLPDPPA